MDKIHTVYPILPIDKFAWKNIPEIRTKLFWRVKHLRKQNEPKIDVLAQFSRGVSHTTHVQLLTRDEWTEEQERISYERMTDRFENLIYS